MSNFISQIDNSWTLFLDRDGVINKRIIGGYVSNWNEFEFLPGVTKAITKFSSVFKYIIIITNQQGVGKGIMTEEELIKLHTEIKNKIAKNGGRIDAIYYCTDLASKKNNCRKPGINMAENAQNDFPDIDFRKSIMIGDSKSDILFGKNAGMKTILHKSADIVDVNSDLQIDGLIEFADMLK